VTALAVVLVVAGGVGGAVQAALMGRWGERVGTLEALAFASLVTALIGTGLARRPGQSGRLRRRGKTAGLALDCGPDERADRCRDHVRRAADRHDGDDRRRRRGKPRDGVIDRFGLFGLEKIAFRWERLLGIMLLAVGAALSLRK
jgi:hypothetical protein